MIDRPSAALGNIGDTGEVQGQVADILRTFAPGHDTRLIDETFALLQRAFGGQLDGYGELKTLYHNTKHTNEVVLCTARMLHGLALDGHGLDATHIDAALIGALMHDVGYLMSDRERNAGVGATGAQFTATHVGRGVEFARRHLSALPPAVLEAAVKVIQVTDHRQHPDWVKFDNAQQRRAAYATATSDLLGQMANGEYLERLLYLYCEFKEAGLGGFKDVHDLLEKTHAFYRLTHQRLENDLDSMGKHLNRHFAATRGEGRNFYLESIERNLRYLETLLREAQGQRLEMLKRGGVVEQMRPVIDAD